MNIQFKVNAKVSAAAVVEVFKSSGIDRPIDLARVQAMLDHSNLIITAWDDDKLVGIARSVTDYNYCCYLSDLAVKKENQQIGIGRTLIELTQNAIGEHTMLVMLSNRPGIEYNPKDGFDKIEHGLLIKRRKE
ncbi:MAG TPA: GNAT family N-acetyltransferase [Bacteroidia bacterium]|jgi:ribosomal protein S18 acetylase RimI-like enzyme|nr:GNAT family N-acetyltransferase [Bacteroidia bacterium]